MVTLLGEKVMLTPKFERHLLQRAEQHLLLPGNHSEHKEVFLASFIGFGLSITSDLSFENLYPS